MPFHRELDPRSCQGSIPAPITAFIMRGTSDASSSWTPLVDHLRQVLLEPLGMTPTKQQKKRRLPQVPIQSTTDVLLAAVVYRGRFRVHARSLLHGAGVTLGMAPVLYGKLVPRADKDDEECSKNDTASVPLTRSKGSVIRNGLRSLEYDEAACRYHSRHQILQEEYTTASNSSSTHIDWEEGDSTEHTENRVFVVEFHVSETDTATELLTLPCFIHEEADGRRTCHSTHYYHHHWRQPLVAACIGVLLFCTIVYVAHHGGKEEPFASTGPNPSQFQEKAKAALLGAFAFVS